MPESSNVEIAHHVHESGEHHHAGGRRRHEVAIEIGEAFRLALVAVATAWSGYVGALGRPLDEASEVFQRGAEARKTGDEYVRTTVLLATGCS